MVQTLDFTMPAQHSALSERPANAMPAKLRLNPGKYIHTEPIQWTGSRSRQTKRSSIQTALVGAILLGMFAVKSNSQTYVGSFAVHNGSSWTNNPPCYTAREAAVLLFGGTTNEYGISTNSNTTDPSTINHAAWLDGWGDSYYLSSPASADFKAGTY